MSDPRRLPLQPLIDRGALIGALHEALARASHVRALWEGGSAAFGALDDKSDIDLSVIVRDGTVPEAIAILERTLGSFAPIEVRYELPQPAWHGHWQCFYRLAGTSPHLFIDVVVMEQSHPRRFTEREIHGELRVLFDHDGLAAPPPLDLDALERARVVALRRYRDRAPLVRSVMEKELARGRSLDAVGFYRSLILDAIVHTLRIRHCPMRHDFGWRYLDRDVPREHVARLRTLAFPSAASLPSDWPAAQDWLDELVDLALSDRSASTPRG